MTTNLLITKISGFCNYVVFVVLCFCETKFLPVFTVTDFFDSTMLISYFQFIELAHIAHIHRFSSILSELININNFTLFSRLVLFGSKLLESHSMDDIQCRILVPEKIVLNNLLIIYNNEYLFLNISKSEVELGF